MFMNETSGELAMLLDMRAVEKEMDGENLVHRSYSEDLDLNSETVSFSSFEPNNNNGGCSPISKNVVSPVPPRKIRTEDFMDSENEKSDYDWLLTPPSTPLFPSMEMESQKNATNKNDMLNLRSTALKPKLVNIQEESNSLSNIASKHLYLQSGQLNSSCAGNKKPSSKASTATASGSATPTSRPTLTKSTKPSRSATPTSRVNAKASVPLVRSSTPAKTTARSSTPTQRSVPTTKQTARSATPNRCPSKPTSSIVSCPTGRSISTSKFSARSSSNPKPSQVTFPSIKTRPSKPYEMPSFPLDEAARPLPERPASTTKGRPVAASNAKSLSIRTMSNGKTRQKPSSPSKQQASNGSSAYSSGKVFPFKQRIRSSDDDNEDSPVVMGTKMVERVVNMRKLAPPKQGEYRSSSGDPSSKSSVDISGFGRTLSNKSLDMALRHMDITRSISSKIRPVVTKIQASSMDDGSSRSAKIGTIVVSPLATSSNGSSAPSTWSSSIRLDGSETEDNDLATEIVLL